MNKVVRFVDLITKTIMLTMKNWIWSRRQTDSTECSPSSKADSHSSIQKSFLLLCN